MIKVYCHTNLDLANERWPSELPALPRVGDIIESATKHGEFVLRLKVCQVTFQYNNMSKEWYPSIELHMCDWMKSLPGKRPGAADGSIIAFYEWYAPLVGKSVGAFI